MAEYLLKKLNVDCMSWHYTESGHGKGAPDGVGGCLKRTADYIVAKGQDVSNFKELIQCLTSNCKGIKVIPITDSVVPDIQSLVSDPQTFKGTMKIHQVSWSRITANIIHARRLTCKMCLPEYNCPHYGIGKIPVLPKHTKVAYSDVYSSDSSDS
ncbi:unnamed protein product [Brassicogethes aeneus]|uniref:Uncharacterized protein n=1 Tax=Brassicogethes aeneus TaxID=1431903 RepID=A0A9P0FM70_BRAAE|nr:unnamed protein product [Brassicogethes aeneus]